jgi:hypothetical protein
MNLIELEITNVYTNGAMSTCAKVTFDPTWIAAVQSCASPGECFIILRDGTTLQVKASYDDMIRDWKQARL